jgi:hypothetical protein
VRNAVLIASICLGGCAIAFLLRVVLPSRWTIDYVRRGTVFALPINRFAFWACLAMTALLILIVSTRALTPKAGM